MKYYRCVVYTDNKEEFNNVKKYIKDNCKETETEFSIEYYYFKESLEDILIGREEEYTEEELDDLTDDLLNSDFSWMDEKLLWGVDTYFKRKK